MKSTRGTAGSTPAAQPRRKPWTAAEAGRKGGEKRVPKGFAKADPGLVAEMSARGVEARRKKRAAAVASTGRPVRASD